MKAAIVSRYGSPDVIRFTELPDPATAPGEVLVRIRATTVSSGDARVRGFNVPGIFWLPAKLALGIFRPRRRVLGTEFAGVVESTAPDVTRFVPGDRVFGMASFSKPAGTHAQLIAISADGLIEPIPESMSFDEAGCLCFGLLTARHFLHQAAKLQPNQRVLVIGASGAVGCAAVQLAKHTGAHVTAVCSTRHTELMHELGADSVIDYKKHDYTKPSVGREPYDIVFDAVGATTPLACRPVMSTGSRFIAVVMSAKTVLQALWCTLTRSSKVIMGVASEVPEDLAYFREMIEAGAYRSVIDRRFTLDQIRDAHRYVDEGHKQGNVIITIDD